MIEATPISLQSLLAVSKDQHERDLVQAFKRLEQISPCSTEIASAPAQHVGEQQMLCLAVASFYEPILGLPTEQGARIVRTLFDEQ